MSVTPFQRILWAFLVVAMITLGAALAVRSFHHSEARADEPLPKLIVLPPFSLTDQNGKTVTNKDLAGKIWVAQFFFTECPGPCPAVSRQLVQVQQMLGTTPGVKLVGISIDPEHDTPAAMAAYGARVGADPKRWKFLTGAPDVIDELVHKGFLISFQKNTPAEQAQGLFLHSTQVALVDRAGIVRAVYEGRDIETPPKIVADIGILLREPPPAP